MCFSQPKPPSPPKPPEPQKLAPPPPPLPPISAPKQLQPMNSSGPDLRIGPQKVVGSSGRKPVSNKSLKSGLNMGGDNGGLNI